MDNQALDWRIRLAAALLMKVIDDPDADVDEQDLDFIIEFASWFDVTIDEELESEISVLEIRE